MAPESVSAPEWLTMGGDRPATGAGALVLGGDYRGLGIVRSLGRRGVPVWVIADDHLLAASSRYVKRRLRWPGTGEAAQIAWLLELCNRHHLEGWVLYPSGDETAALIAGNHALLAGKYRLSTPPWDTLRWAHDKRLTYALAAQLGVSCPWTAYPASRDELRGLSCSFPVILKPAYKHGLNSFTRNKAWKVDSREELLDRYDEAAALVPPDVIMVQELIPGGGEAQYSYGALCVDGHPIASIVARRSRQHPVDFGRASTYVESVEEPEVEALALRLLSGVGYTGLVEVEFKRDPIDGRLKLLDINPRVWGWHTLAQRAGVDLPYLLWKLAQGQPVAAVRARPGVRWIRMTTDLQAVVSELRSGCLTPRSYLSSLGGTLEFAIFALDDPLPALLDVPLLLYLALLRASAAKRFAGLFGS